ncbi:O-antigen ligase family protein [Georgenia thermotolerans]|uniref:O-antigen ligase family protein n=1 Tax=Georgenia thermotolerans TaxID=527326 RepID=A0A7J5URZ9_9MICO|nr:O-antigen ligase family protein [Georgenia thermotolerans]KAE8765232.1 hypothetical protein GB883_04680 [Georgenia thermotolerans]
MSFFLISYPRIVLPSIVDSMWWLAGLALLVVLIDHRQISLRRPPLAMAVFLAFCLTSLAWSLNPSATATSVLLYAWIALLALTVTSNTDSNTLARGIRWGGLLTACSAVKPFVTTLTETGATVASTPLLGVHGNRNIVSYTLLLALCAGLTYRPSGRLRRIRWATAVCVILAVLLLARSATGYLATIAVLAVWGGLTISARMTPRRAARSRIAVASATTGTAILAALNIERISEFMGRTSSLSGRLPLWRAIIEASGDAAIRGDGWGAVWAYAWRPAPPNEMKQLIDELTGFPLSHGHNAVLDLLPQVGLIGVGICVLIVLRALVVVLIPTTRDAAGTVAWIGTTITALLVMGATEPMFTVPLGWFLLVACATRAEEVGGIRHRSARISEVSSRGRTGSTQDRFHTDYGIEVGQARNTASPPVKRGPFRVE